MSLGVNRTIYMYLSEFHILSVRNTTRLGMILFSNGLCIFRKCLQLNVAVKDAPFLTRKPMNVILMFFFDNPYLCFNSFPPKEHTVIIWAL